MGEEVAIPLSSFSLRGNEVEMLCCLNVKHKHKHDFELCHLRATKDTISFQMLLSYSQRSCEVSSSADEGSVVVF